MRDRPTSGLGRFFYNVLSPFHALHGAQVIGNRTRANTQVDLLQKVYGNDVFHSVVFENTSDVSMSWFLTADDRSKLKESVNNDSRNLDALERLARLLAVRKP